jgi:vacuolar fusion protein MON1
MSAVWQNHRRHVLAFSHAGKPVYSRYGDLGAQAGLVSVASALLMKSVELGDKLRSFSTGDTEVIIVTRGPLTFMAILRTGESGPAVRELLRAVYNHILFVLTGKAILRLTEKPNTDIRTQLLGTEGSTHNLLR